MTDDAFHLTSHDVRAQEFQKVMRGFDPAQVEEFKQRMAEEIDRLVRDRVQLDERVKGLSDQLKSFRNQERAMNDALLQVQQLRADAQGQVDRERELVIREAQAEAEAIRAAARSEAELLSQSARQEQQQLVHANDQVRRQYQAYLTGYRQLLERQLQELDALNTAQAETTDGEPPRTYRRQA